MASRIDNKLCELISPLISYQLILFDVFFLSSLYDVKFNAPHARAGEGPFSLLAVPATPPSTAQALMRQDEAGSR